MLRSLRALSALPLAATLALSTPAAAQYAFSSSEAAFDSTFAATPIALTGAVIDEGGAPISGATLTAIGWGFAAGNNGLSAASNAAGAFTFGSLARRSVLLRVEHPGYYTEIVAIDLHRPLAEASTDAGDIVLTLQKPGRARLIFGGDSMFGRRFTDSDEDGIQGEAGDLIRPTTRAGDATSVMRYLADALGAADYSLVNLETPVTAYPEVPHPYKSFTFSTHPETLAGLLSAGVDGVSLGNNHVYDYLEPGLLDTLIETSDAGLDWCGAGLTESEAEASMIYRTVGNGVQVALQGFDLIVNDGTTEPAYALVARDPPHAKAGALEMSAANITTFLTTAAPTRLAIPVLHGGGEYSDYPTSLVRSRMVQAAQGGATVVVAHHPHEVQGVGLLQTPGGPRFVLMSLGNLVFDQDVFETFQSYIAMVDLDQTAPGVGQVRKIQLVPFHIEGYVPKPVAGEHLARIGRHVGHLSTTLPAAADGMTGAVVFPAGNRIVVAGGPAGYSTTDTVTNLSAALTGGATGALEYQRLDPADMLAHVQTSTPRLCEVGRELGIYGDFEDLDVDAQYGEGFMWDQSSVRSLENSVTRSGNGAMVFLRLGSSTSTASTFMKNRVRFTPGKALTLRGFLKGSNAGQTQVQVYWYTEGGTSISNSTVYTRAAGTYDWEPFSVDLTAPANAGSVRAYYRASPPASGEANTFLDDVALIQWEQSIADASPGWALPSPNAWSFLRCSGGGGSSVDISLTHRLFAPAPMVP